MMLGQFFIRYFLINRIYNKIKIREDGNPIGNKVGDYNHNVTHQYISIWLPRCNYTLTHSMLISIENNFLLNGLLLKIETSAGTENSFLSIYEGRADGHLLYISPNIFLYPCKFSNVP